MIPSHTAVCDTLRIHTGNLVRSHSALYMLFVVLVNITAEPFLCDAIGSNKNKFMVVCKTQITALKKKNSQKASVGALMHVLNS